MQPTHATSDMPWAPARLGAERVAGAYAWRRLGPSPAELAFGSDFPVESPDPLAGLYAAVTCQRQDGLRPTVSGPTNVSTSAKRCRPFTWGAAHCLPSGRPARPAPPGYFADLTVLDLDPLKCSPRELLGAHVAMTIVNGRALYSSAR
jgi:predicted amidohydrolase YtcJ